MKNNEYVAPEMESVKIEISKPLLDVSDPTIVGGNGNNTGYPDD